MTVYIGTLIIGFMLLFIAVYLFSRIRSIDKNAETVEGIIYENTTGNDPGEANSSAYYPVVRFVTKQDRVWVTQQANIGFPAGVYKPGDKVEIVYRVDRPTAFYINDKKTKTVLIFLLVVGCAAIIFGAYRLYTGLPVRTLQ